MKLAAELAVKEINAKGGVAGRPLELIEKDDHSSEDSAVVVAEQLYQSDAVAVIGGAYSSATLASAPIYNGGRDPLVQLSPSASSPLLTQAGEYTFRLCPSDLAYGAALAKYAAQQGYRRAAIVYVNDDYGRGVRRTFSEEFGKAGGSVVELDPFLATAPEARPYLARLLVRHQAQVIVLAANQQEGLVVLDQIRKAKLGLPILAGDGMVGAERTDPVTMEGVLVSSSYLIGDPNPTNQTFVSAYRKANPQAGPPDQGAAATYDAVYLLARVIAEAGPGRTDVRRALAQVGRGRPAYEGVVGRIAFDSLGDVPQLEVKMGIARSGILEPSR
jgi:branched-chain amino acid transport system substrate-binding protein